MQPSFFLLQLCCWNVALLSNHSLNYVGISSLFDLSKSKSHLNPSKYCTITGSAVVCCSKSQFKSCSKEKRYKCTDSLAQSAVTIYEMFDRLQYFKVHRIFWTFFLKLISLLLYLAV